MSLKEAIFPLWILDGYFNFLSMSHLTFSRARNSRAREREWELKAEAVISYKSSNLERYILSLVLYVVSHPAQSWNNVEKDCKRMGRPENEGTSEATLEVSYQGGHLLRFIKQEGTWATSYWMKQILQPTIDINKQDINFCDAKPMRIQSLVWHCPAIQNNKALIKIPLQKEAVMIKRT